MTEKTKKPAIIRNALVWATTMIATSIILTGTNISSEQSGSILIIQIAGWFVSDAAIRSGGISLKQEITCLRQLFKGSRPKS